MIRGYAYERQTHDTTGVWHAARSLRSLWRVQVKVRGYLRLEKCIRSRATFWAHRPLVLHYFTKFRSRATLWAHRSFVLQRFTGFRSPAMVTAQPESSSERCKMCESISYGHIFHVVSGGFLKLAGRHADGSNKIGKIPRHHIIYWYTCIRSCVLSSSLHPMTYQRCEGQLYNT